MQFAFTTENTTTESLASSAAISSTTKAIRHCAYMITVDKFFMRQIMPNRQRQLQYRIILFENEVIGGRINNNYNEMGKNM